jgi:hypothetical protein
MIGILPAFEFNANRCKDGRTGIFGPAGDAARRAPGRQPTVHHAARMGAQSARGRTQKAPAAASRAPP